ncbi:MAG TPA: glycerol-3-phosphate dehydrogenase/oxidase [Bryobacteraceae bacterium]|nr:glycerol-3-phosphate dehydrogenase/oxidase [Bryobacteraceae bacterium]
MSGFPSDLRTRSLAALRGATVDVLILGGGINGAGIARDLGMRRQQSGVSLQVALVEQGHFASGASGRNSQLIHGGLRYLKYLKFGLVKESLHERSVLRFLAPHLVEPLAFLLPLYSRIDKMKYLMGLRIYDQLAGDANISKHREVSKAEILQSEPELSSKGLVGGALFYDCLVNSARFVLENLFEAAANGVFIANYTCAQPVERSPDGVWQVKLEDTLTGEQMETKCKKLVDASGAWSHPDESPPRLVRGSHLILPRLTSEEHAVAYFDDSGRIVFLIPWGSDKQLTLLGTTDVDHQEGPDNPHIAQEEIDYLLGIARRLYPNAPSFTPLASYSSLRPLVSDGAGSPTAATREHKIFNSKDGILRIQGGKYTTYRLMSQEAVNLLLKEIAPWLMAASKTAEEPLCGNTAKALARLKSDALRLSEQYHIAPGDVERIIGHYGIHTPDVLQMIAREEFGPISRTDYARMANAVQHEMALRLPDVMYVSTQLGFERRWDAVQLEPYAQLMGAWLGWDLARQNAEVELALKVTALPGAPQ